jgi:hypothetical protein
MGLVLLGCAGHGGGRTSGGCPCLLQVKLNSYLRKEICDWPKKQLNRAVFNILDLHLRVVSVWVGCCERVAVVIAEGGGKGI